jgi:hypothetical protein
MESVTVGVVESSRGRAGKEFVEFPHRLYRGSRQWVPQFRVDVRRILDRKHPSFEQCEARFFLARRAGEPAGTIGAIVNSAYNAYHHTKIGHFHFFDCVDDREVSHALVAAALDWLRGKGMEQAVGPFGFGVMSMGVLVEGFEHRAAMTMMGYNGPWYGPALEAEGFAKHRDLFAMYFEADSFTMPDRIRRVAQIVMKRGSFEISEMRSKRDLIKRAQDIGRVYNDSFLSRGDIFYPLSRKEIHHVTDELLMVADPPLIQLLVHKGEIAGFLFGFPDLSAALQRARGRITPWGIVDLLLEYRRTRWLVVNGAGILPQYQRLGGNALLYFMLEKIASRKRFLYADAVQISETTELMLADMKTLGGKIFKVHRLYTRSLL